MRFTFCDFEKSLTSKVSSLKFLILNSQFSIIYCTFAALKSIQDMNTTRQQKIASLLQRELANIFLQDSKSIYGCMITVTKATITPDLSIARAYLSIYMASDKDAVIGAVRANTKDIRFRLGQQVKDQLRIVPQLEFFIDDTLDYIENIDRLLKQ